MSEIHKQLASAYLEGMHPRITIDVTHDGDRWLAGVSYFIDGAKFGTRWIDSAGTIVLDVWNDDAWLALGIGDVREVDRHQTTLLRQVDNL